jgi:hypothetical protein
MMRNVVSTIEVNVLEARIARAFQSDLSAKMRPLGRPLEAIAQSKKSSLGPKELQQVGDQSISLRSMQYQ